MSLSRSKKRTAKRKRRSDVAFEGANSVDNYWFKRRKVYSTSDENMTSVKNMGVLNFCMKSYDTRLTNMLISGLTPLNNTRCLTLNSIPMGYDNGNRIGTKVAMKSLEFFFWLHPNWVDPTPAAANTPFNENLRIIIGYDRQPQYDTVSYTPFANPSDLLQSTVVDGSVAAGQESFAALNLNNLDRFLILLDLKITLPGFHCAGPTSFLVNEVLNSIDPLSTNTLREGFIQLNNLNSTYGKVIGSASLPHTGALFCLTFSDDTRAGSSTSPWLLDAGFRLKFYDL